MQVFRTEAFETMGKILPRAAAIAGQISGIYLALTVLCALTYLALGMGGFDAVVHALTTMSTGGFSNYDASFGTFSGPAEYAASVFMILAALPFVRAIELVRRGVRMEAVPIRSMQKVDRPLRLTFHGLAEEQLQQIGIIDMFNAGFTGSISPLR